MNLDDIEQEMIGHSQRKIKEKAKAEYVVNYIYENKEKYKELEELDKALFNDRISVDYAYNKLKELSKALAGDSS